MKTLDNFYRDTAAVLGRATSCAECRRVSSKQFREENKQYYRKYLQNNREALQEYRQQWLKANYRKTVQYSQRQHEKLKEAMDRMEPDDKEYLQSIDRQQHICPVTGSTEAELDHIMPVSRGNWGNNRGNLMYLHKPLNTSKSNKNVFDWLEQMEQETLDYLLPENCVMTVDQFKQKYLEILQQKAAEKEMTIEQYKQQYNEDYFKEEQ